MIYHDFNFFTIFDGVYKDNQSIYSHFENKQDMKKSPRQIDSKLPKVPLKSLPDNNAISLRHI